MSSDVQSSTSPGESESGNRWAPWWIYLVVIAPANIGKEQLLPAESAWWLRAVLTAILVAAGIAVVTAVYRAGRDPRRQPW